MIIDIDKFVASIMKCLCMPHREEAYLCRHWINKALDAQGLKFENGEIVKNQRRVAAEAKEAIFDGEDERIRKIIIDALHGVILNMEETNKAIAWLEKQGKQKSIWHNEDEEPQRGSLILLIMQSGTPVVAKVIEPNHIFNHGERWAYIDDLLEKQGELPEGCVRKQVAEAKEALYTAEVGSEDERMKNAAIRACKYMIDNFENSTKDYEDAIAWLEKQGATIKKTEHKFSIGDIISNGEVVYRVDDIVKNYVGKDCYFLVNIKIEKDGMRYATLFDSEGNPHNIGEITWLCEQVDVSFQKQLSQSEVTKTSKQVWSEEDEAMLNQAIEEVEYALNDKSLLYTGNENVLVWLKSLKQRMKGE